MDLSKLKRKYTGDVAKKYEDIRVGEKWEKENQIVEEFLTSVVEGEDALILDVPVGTGRLFDAYRQLGVTVVGYDVSQDMVWEAQEKTSGTDDITVSVKDFFDIGGEVNPEVLVSLRFLRWLDFEDVKGFFEKLSEIGADHVIVGIRYLVEEGSSTNGEHEIRSGEASELSRLLSASAELVQSKGIGTLLGKGWSYVYSKFRRVMGKIKGAEMISRHKKSEIDALISESEYEVNCQKHVKTFSGRERYDIFLLSKKK
jgi:hypothetical protein